MRKIIREETEIGDVCNRGRRGRDQWICLSGAGGEGEEGESVWVQHGAPRGMGAATSVQGEVCVLLAKIGALGAPRAPWCPVWDAAIWDAAIEGRKMEPHKTVHFTSISMKRRAGWEACPVFSPPTLSLPSPSWHGGDFSAFSPFSLFFPPLFFPLISSARLCSLSAVTLGEAIRGDLPPTRGCFTQ